MIIEPIAAQGKRIRAARRAIGYTQRARQLALGIPHHSQISRWERGEARPGPEVAARLLDVLGADVGPIEARGPGQHVAVERIDGRSSRP